MCTTHHTFHILRRKCTALNMSAAEQYLLNDIAYILEPFGKKLVIIAHGLRKRTGVRVKEQVIVDLRVLECVGGEHLP